MRWIRRLPSFLPVVIVLAICSVAVGLRLTYGQEAPQRATQDKPIIVKNYRLGGTTLVCEADAIVSYRNGEPIEVQSARLSAEDDLGHANFAAALDEQNYSGLDGNIVFIESVLGTFVPGWRNCVEEPAGGDVHEGVTE